MGIQTFDEDLVLTLGQRVDSGTYPSATNLWSNPSSPARIDALILGNQDVIDHNVTIVLDIGGSGDLYLGTVLLPAGAGTLPGVPTIECFAVFPGLAAGIPVPQSSSLNLLTAEDLTSGYSLTTVTLAGRL